MQRIQNIHSTGTIWAVADSRDTINGQLERLWRDLARPWWLLVLLFCLFLPFGSVIRPPPADRARSNSLPGPLKIHPTRAWRLHFSVSFVCCGVRSVVAYRYLSTVNARWRYSGVTNTITKNRFHRRRTPLGRCEAAEVAREGHVIEHF